MQVDRELQDIYWGLVEGIRRFAGPMRVAFLRYQPSDFSLHLVDPDGLFTGQPGLLETIKKSYVSWSDEEKEQWLRFGRDVVIGDMHGETIKVPAHSLRRQDRLTSGIWFASLPNDAEWTRSLFRQYLLEAKYYTGLLLNNKTERAPTASEALKHSLARFDFRAVVREVRARLSSNFNEETVVKLLRSFLAISRSREEGSRANGTLSVHPEPTTVSDDQIFQFSETGVLLEHSKHLGKVLSLSDTPTAIELDGKDALKGEVAVPSGKYVLCDETKAVAMAAGSLPEGSLALQLVHGRGRLSAVRERDGILSADLIAYIEDGRFHARTVNSTEYLKRSLADDELAECTLQAVTTIARSARQRGHGCILVIDEQAPQRRVAYAPGDWLEEPLSLDDEASLSLAELASKVDGACMMDRSGSFYAFGCILSGEASEKEDRGRGARHNSAIRYTESFEGSLAIVVSEDGPVTVFPRRPSATDDLTPDGAPLTSMPF